MRTHRAHDGLESPRPHQRVERARARGGVAQGAAREVTERAARLRLHGRRVGTRLHRLDDRSRSIALSDKGDGARRLREARGLVRAPRIDREITQRGAARLRQDRLAFVLDERVDDRLHRIRLDQHRQMARCAASEVADRETTLQADRLRRAVQLHRIDGLRART